MTIWLDTVEIALGSIVAISFVMFVLTSIGGLFWPSIFDRDSER